MKVTFVKRIARRGLQIGRYLSCKVSDRSGDLQSLEAKDVCEGSDESKKSNLGGDSHTAVSIALLRCKKSKIHCPLTSEC